MHDMGLAARLNRTTFRYLSYYNYYLLNLLPFTKHIIELIRSCTTCAQFFSRSTTVQEEDSYAGHVVNTFGSTSVSSWLVGVGPLLGTAYK